MAAADSPGCRRTAPPGCRSCACRDRRCRRSRASRSAPLMCCTSPAASIASSQARRSCFDAVDGFLGGARFAPRISATVISTLLARRLGSLARCPHEAELNSRSSCAFRLASSLRTALPSPPERTELLPLPFKISFSRCGVTGSCVTAPGMPMASSMAEAIAAPTPVMPLSPAPLMPSGLSGLA